MGGAVIFWAPLLANCRPEENDLLLRDSYPLIEKSKEMAYRGPSYGLSAQIANKVRLLVTLCLLEKIKANAFIK